MKLQEIKEGFKQLWKLLKTLALEELISEILVNKFPQFFWDTGFNDKNGKPIMVGNLLFLKDKMIIGRVIYNKNCKEYFVRIVGYGVEWDADYSLCGLAGASEII